MRVLGTRELVVHCNNVQVLNVAVTGATCDRSDWNDVWSLDVDNITFSQSDTASKYFKTGGCMHGDFLFLKIPV